MMQGIYRIRNKINDKRYVGSTNDFEKGWIVRRQVLRKGSYHNIHLQRAWNKYGEESFVFEIEEEVAGNNRALLVVEQVYLDEGFVLGNLYNIAKDATAFFRGMHHTEEAKLVIGQAAKERGFSEEHKHNISLAKKGKPKSEEHKRKLREANKGQIPWNKGKTDVYTEATLQQISETLNGRSCPQHSQFMKEWYKTHDVPNSKAYPAFYNEITNERTPGGRNLAKLCREHGLNYGAMISLSRGDSQSTRDGWRVGFGDETSG